ncbi:MAG: hypothetical protein WCP21_06610 [Armatimonadota bacterium]
MPQLVDLAAPLQRLSPGEGQFFFGYYDVPAADARGRHLCHQVAFRDRFPTPTDEAVIGWMGVPPQGAGTFHPFAATLAWNFQQGSMLQWLPNPDTCLYNTFREGAFGCCVHNVATGEQRHLPLAVANVAQDGSKALCVNMPRIYDFRPGYGYEELPDPYAAVTWPAEDGVSVMDLRTGEHELVLSLGEAAYFLEALGEGIGGRKVVINHLTFNPSANRYLFLLRSMDKWPWLTWLVTADTNGGDLRHHQAFGSASHYHWRNDREMLFYMRVNPEQYELVLVDDDTDERTPIDTAYFLSDGHCSYSPDGKWLLYDSYPGGSTEDYFRALQVYSLERREGITLGRFRSESTATDKVDLRCDLHPRWMPDGKSVSFDSIHEGFRGVYWMDIGGIVG